MEMHHRLRRDPNWHPSACNLCGQLGHMAAACTQGTINWKAIYGEDSFKIKEPFFPSEIYKILDAKKVDTDELEQRAKDYAKAAAAQQGLDYEEMMGLAEASRKVDHEAMAAAAMAAAEAAAEASQAAAAAPQANGDAGDTSPLAEGWSEAKDAQGRTYYWHTKTKKTQWDRPTADTLIE